VCCCLFLRSRSAWTMVSLNVCVQPKSCLSSWNNFRSIVLYFNHPKNFLQSMVTWLIVCAEACTEVLHIIRGLAPALDAEVVQTCLPVLAPLLATVSVQSVRSAVCQTLQEFAQCDSSLSTVVSISPQSS
jgi:hypothetical protein